MSDLLSDLTNGFAQHRAIVEIDFSGDYPVVLIHDPENPQAFEIVAGMIAAMDALTSGADGVTDEMITKAESAARALLDNAIAQLNHGARQTLTFVDFSENKPDEAQP